MIEIRIDSTIPRDGLVTCEALLALLSDMLCGRTDVEFGERGLLGLYLIISAQQQVMRDIGKQMAA